MSALDALREGARGCPACPLARSRTQVVFDDGDPAARVVIVGEGPGGDEDRTGKPFVGQGGQLLDRILAAAGLARAECYLTNVVKCRPPGNRTPQPAEVVACERWLVPQLAALRPEVILALGNTAAQHLLNTTQGVTKLRGTWHPYHNAAGGWDAWLVPLFHPAYLLRQDTRAPGGPKSLTWRDIREVKAFLDGQFTPPGPAVEAGEQTGLFINFGRDKQREVS